MTEIHWTLFKGTAHQFYSNIIDLRYAVLRKPWNQPRSSAIDNTDSASYHVTGHFKNQLVACGRLTLNNNTGQIRYMAVLPDFQGQGLGKKLMECLENEARQHSVTELVLNARENALDFYSRCGYLNAGYVFTLWEKIPHYKMYKVLNAKSSNAPANSESTRPNTEPF